MTLVIGVDIGGTGARAVVVDDERRVSGRGEAPGAAASLPDPGSAAQAAIAAARSAAEAAGASLPVDALWAGVAGAGREPVRLAVQARLEGAGLAHRTHVGTDVEAAFHDAFGRDPGVLLIAGTGSIGWARGRSGGTIRVGGWGERLGDEGSAYWIGLDALRSLVSAEDGRGPATSLRRSILAHLALDGPDDLVSWIASADKRGVAALAPFVLEAAESGDRVAGALLDAAAEELAAHVEALLGRVGRDVDEAEVVLWGGLLREGGAVTERLIRLLEARPTPVRVGDLDPARGAAHLALDLAAAATE